MHNNNGSNANNINSNMKSKFKQEHDNIQVLLEKDIFNKKNSFVIRVQKNTILLLGLGFYGFIVFLDSITIFNGKTLKNNDVTIFII